MVNRIVVLMVVVKMVPVTRKHQGAAQRKRMRMVAARGREGKIVVPVGPNGVQSVNRKK